MTRREKWSVEAVDGMLRWLMQQPLLRNDYSAPPILATLRNWRDSFAFTITKEPQNKRVQHWDFSPDNVEEGEAEAWAAKLIASE